MGELGQKFRRPDMVHIMGKIFQEHRPRFGTRLNIVPDRVQRQTRGGFVTLLEPRP